MLVILQSKASNEVLLSDTNEKGHRNELSQNDDFHLHGDCEQIKKTRQ